MKLKPVYLNAPILIAQTQLNSAEELSSLDNSKIKHNCRSWTERRLDRKYTFDLAKKTVQDYIKNGTILEGTAEDKEADSICDRVTDAGLPIVGLVGFSQGAAFGAAMVDKFEELYNEPPLQWAIIFSGYMFDTQLMPEHKYLYSTDGGLLLKPTRMLHVIGELDTVVSEDRSMQLYEVYEKISTVLKHPGGHFVPHSRPFVEQVTNWINTEEAPVDRVKEENSGLDSLLDMMKDFGG